MTLRAAVAVTVTETTQVGVARRTAVAAARALNFDETLSGKVAVVVTELANNLIKHGSGGELVCQIDRTKQCVQLWALDNGRGMSNVTECMRDGYSTAGSPGTGLGAVARLASTFEIFSQPNKGTAVYAEIGAQSAHVDGCSYGAISVPRLGEVVCGDGWAPYCDASNVGYMVVDGLGHGSDAAQAAEAALAVWDEDTARTTPVEFLQHAHVALHATRGAAMALAIADRAKRVIHYAGVGNISATIVAPSLATRSMVSSNGTVGMETRRVQEFHYPYERGAVLVMYSDGIGTHWRLESYAGLIMKHPGLIAGVLYRDQKRGRDDATVLVAKLN